MSSNSAQNDVTLGLLKSLAKIIYEMAEEVRRFRAYDTGFSNATGDLIAVFHLLFENTEEKGGNKALNFVALGLDGYEVLTEGFLDFCYKRGYRIDAFVR